MLPLAIALTAITGALALSSPARAAVITLDLTNAGSTGQNITGANYGFGTASTSSGTNNVIDFFPGGGRGDLQVIYSPYNTYWNGLIPSNGLKLAVTGGDVSAKTYSMNELISLTGVTWSDTTSETLFNYYPSGTEIKHSNIDAGYYLGLQSQVGADFYYGWLEVTWDQSDGFGGVARLLSAAYESTPNLPIKAGSFTSGPGTSVPGPLPILGAAAAYTQSRRMRSRIHAASAIQS